MAVIGIDPGTALTGYGIVQKNKVGSLDVIDFGVIRTSKNQKPADRLHTLFHNLNEIVSQYKIESSAIERLYFQNNTTTAISVGQARGVAMLSMAEADIRVYEYNPVEIKQSVTGYGKATKKQIQEMVRILLNLDEIPKPDDAADALAVAICHIHSYKIKSLESNK